MSEVVLPKVKRPLTSYKKCGLGVDLPSWFVHDLWAIDPKLYPVWHEFDVLWDMVINEGLGTTEEPRYPIQFKHGHLSFGFILTLGDGSPKKDRSWHIWRLSDPGWSHVVKIQDRKNPEYLKYVLDRLYFHAIYDGKYGRFALNKKIFEQQENARQKAIQDRLEQQNLLDKENRAVWREVLDNFLSGKIAPQVAQKDIIVSYPGQSNRSRITRPMTDKEIGLYTGDKDNE